MFGQTTPDFSKRPKSDTKIIIKFSGSMSLTTKRVAALAASAPQEQGSHGDLDYSLASGGTPGGPSLAAQVRFKTKDTEVAVDVPTQNSLE